MVEIRSASLRDVGELATLLGELGYPVAAEAVPARLERYTLRGNGRVLVACVDDCVVAFAAFDLEYPIYREHPVACVSAFAVSQRVRRSGVGRRLIRAIEDEAVAAGCEAVVVTSAEHRDGAHAFYPAVGWGRTGRRYGEFLA